MRSQSGAVISLKQVAIILIAYCYHFGTTENIETECQYVRDSNEDIGNSIMNIDIFGSEP